VKADAPGKVSEDGEAPPPRTIPDTLPDITLPDRQGTPRSLSNWKGQPVIVNFWATWCGPCREEIPLLNTLRKERSADRLEVVGIAIDEREAVLKFANEIGMDYPVLMGEQEGYEAAERFGVSLVLPFSVFADSQGRIVALKVGELHADQAAAILDRVRDVDANRLSLADARHQIADKLRDLATEQGQKAAADDAG
jgi:thiol-disulfide isomerase/thioredoxin